MVRVKEVLQREIDNGVTKRELAKRIKIPNASLFNYLYGDIEPRYPSLERIAKYFNKPIAYFLEESGSDSQAPALPSHPKALPPSDLPDEVQDLMAAVL